MIAKQLPHHALVQPTTMLPQKVGHSLGGAIEDASLY